MDQPDPNLDLLPEPSEAGLGRRELLKALAVGGGVIAVSTVLPGHMAQARSSKPACSPLTPWCRPHQRQPQLPRPPQLPLKPQPQPQNRLAD